MKQVEIQGDGKCWIDDSNKFGKSQLSISFAFFMGLGGIGLALYVLWLVVVGWVELDAGGIIAIISAAFFLLTGVIVATAMYNLSRRLKVLTISSGRISIEFWWQLRGKTIEFPVNDLLDISLCNNTQSLTEFFRRLPAEKLCYEINIAKKGIVVVAGEGEEIFSLFNYVATCISPNRVVQ